MRSCRVTTRRAVMNWIAIVFMTAVSSGGAEPAQSPGEGERREWTKAEVEALIEKAGRTRPDWWESVPLDYPKTLDLNWPKPPPGWNTAKHIGHYMFSVINENPSPTTVT